MRKTSAADPRLFEATTSIASEWTSERARRFSPVVLSPRARSCGLTIRSSRRMASGSSPSARTWARAGRRGTGWRTDEPHYQQPAMAGA